MSSKKDFVEYLRATVRTEEWALAPAHQDPGRNALLLDRAGYDSGEYGEQEYEYEEYTGEDGFPGYCSGAIVLRGVAPEFKEIAVEFEDSCRSAYSIYDYSPGPGLVWNGMSDFEWDLERFLEAK